MNEDLVISGISGRFPESDNLDEFWHNLITNTDMVTDDHRRYPPNLFEMPQRSGKLKNLEKFDAEFFGYTDDHADSSDPIFRMLHEVVFEALIDSGNDPAVLSGKKIGVFVANEYVDRHDVMVKSVQHLRNNRINGTYSPFLANNISYFFNFKGPSYTLSSACNSGATALNQAILNIVNGQCDSAIIAGCQLNLNPLMTLAFHSRRVLSMDGKSKFMDEKADGYARSEVCCAVYLERAKLAKRVYSRVLSSGVNHDGYKDKRYVPSSDAIKDLILETISKAKVDKNRILYVECHGAGTKFGDLAEVTALNDALCSDNRTDPLWLGSVKTNAGHAECGAFMCALAKVLLIFEQGFIPANLHLDKLNSKFANLTKIKHIGNNMEYDGGPYLITSLAVGASNAVTLLEPYEPNIRKSPQLDYPEIIPLFSRTEDGIRQAIKKINDYSFFAILTPDFIKMIYNIANLQNMNYRGYILLHKLNDDGTLSYETHYSDSQCKKRLIFNFGDINCEIIESLSVMLAKFKLFKEFNDKSHKYYQDRNIKFDLLDDKARNFLNNVINVMSMVNLLLSLNVLPDQCISNSVFGQLFSAYVNRDLTDEHLLQTAYQISKLNIHYNRIDAQILANFIKINCTGHFYKKFVAGEYVKKNIPDKKIDNTVLIDFSSKDSETAINITDDCIRLNIFSESDFQTNVLTLLGRLYEWGLDIEWNALYASSGQYPVSRGTQSVVPLLQWDHSKDYFVPKYTDFL